MTIAGLFDGVQKINRRRSARAAGIAAVAFTAPFFIAGAAGIRINASPSLPLGLYKETTDLSAHAHRVLSPGTVREFRRWPGISITRKLPGWGSSAHETGSRKRRRQSWRYPSRGIAVNGVLLPNTAPKDKDSQGRPMQPWPFGQYRVPPWFRMGSVILQPMELRQPLFWPAPDRHHS